MEEKDEVSPLMRAYLEKKKQSNKQEKTKEFSNKVSDLMKDYLTQKTK